MSDERLRRWIAQLVATPGLTAIKDLDEAWREHVERSLEAVDVVSRFDGPIVDVGSGGGSPGIPLAFAFSEREVTLLESQERKAEALARLTVEFPNVSVVRGRAEEHETDRYAVAVARALAPPPVAAEWCLPLVASGGAVVLYVGPSADLEHVQRVADRVGGGRVSEEPGLLVIPKIAHTPEGFPRRPGVAKKRPLA
ncbi:MAG: class I SAM-dependent methyltransferase [Actinobacteria bacterium]|nr:class I SAM-dependent methyltransferase [Actinomycetota bacterium]